MDALKAIYSLTHGICSLVGGKWAFITCFTEIESRGFMRKLTSNPTKLRDVMSKSSREI